MRAITIGNETEMQTLGKELGKLFAGGSIIYLEGDLGAGKTTFARGFIRSYNHTCAIKSPTYTLVESYPGDCLTIHHFDLYRIADPEELEFIGIIDYFSQETISLIEWPDRGKPLLPAPDLTVRIHYKNSKRKVTLIPHSPAATRVIEKTATNR